MAAEPLWDQFAALLPAATESIVPTHPLGCHRRRIADRIMFEKLIQVLRFGCSYARSPTPPARPPRSGTAATSGSRSGSSPSWTRSPGSPTTASSACCSTDIAVDGCITKAPGGGECAGPSPVDRRKQGMKRRCWSRATASRWAGCWPGRTGTTPRCWPPPWTDSTTSARSPTTSPSTWTPATTRTRPATCSTERGLPGEIAHKGEKAPIQARQRWHVERTNAWHNAFNRLQRCYERREDVIDAFFDLADAIITVRSLIRQAWTTYRWDTRPARRP